APFAPDRSSVPCSGRVFDADELVHLVDASLDFWLTTGRFAERFEREFAAAFGARRMHHSLTTGCAASPARARKYSIDNGLFGGCHPPDRLCFKVNSGPQEMSRLTLS